METIKTKRRKKIRSRPNSISPQFTKPTHPIDVLCAGKDGQLLHDAAEWIAVAHEGLTLASLGLHQAGVGSEIFEWCEKNQNDLRWHNVIRVSIEYWTIKLNKWFNELDDRPKCWWAAKESKAAEHSGLTDRVWGTWDSFLIVTAGYLVGWTGSGGLDNVIC
jgi:hypothetical protein